MAKWRKVHIDDVGWSWTASKKRGHVVIKSPDGKYHTVNMDEWLEPE